MRFAITVNVMLFATASALPALTVARPAAATRALTAARPAVAPLSHRPLFPTPRAKASCIATEEQAAEVCTESTQAEAVPPLSLDRTTKLQLAILLSTGFLVQMGVGAIIVILPAFAQSLGLGAMGVGLLVALPQITKLLFNLPAGFLTDAVGRKPVLLVGGILDAAGQLCTAAATSLWQLVPARLLVGIGSATSWTSTQAYTMDVVGKYPQHSGLLLGLIQAIGFLAFATGPAVGGMLGSSAGPALPIRALGLVLLLSTPLKLLLPETLLLKRRAGAGGMGGRSAAMRASYARLLADRRQVGLLAMKCAFLSGLSLILTVVPLHATATWGATTGALGRLYSTVTLLSLVVSPVAGVLADRVGRVRLAIGGSVATALACAAMPLLGTSRAGAYALRSVWAAGEALLITAYTALALDYTPEDQRGARASLDNQAGDVALLFLPLLFGLLGSVSHSAAFVLGSALMLACNVLFARLVGPSAAVGDGAPTAGEEAGRGLAAGTEAR